MESSHFVQYSEVDLSLGGRGVVNGMENHKSGIASQQGKKPDRQESRGGDVKQTSKGKVGGSISFLPAAKMRSISATEYCISLQMSRV